MTVITGYNITITDGTTGGTILISAPVTLAPSWSQEAATHAVTGNIVKRDLPNRLPAFLKITGMNISMTLSDLNQLYQWYIDGTDLTIEDDAPNAYYSEWYGKIYMFLDSVISPFKMASENWEMTFIVSGAS